MLRRVVPPAGSLPARLLAAHSRGGGVYADCFELALPLAPTPQLAGAAAAAPPLLAAAAAAAVASTHVGAPLAVPPTPPPSDDAHAWLADNEALSAYLRAFYSSAAFAPERALMGAMPASAAVPSVSELLRAEFHVGESVGLFRVSYRGPLLPPPPPGGGPDSAAPLASRAAGSEAALTWRLGGIAGYSYHALTVRDPPPPPLPVIDDSDGSDSAQPKGGFGGLFPARRRRGGAPPSGERQLVVHFGSALWRAAPGDAPHALHPAGDGGPGSRVSPSLPLGVTPVGPLHRAYSRVLLGAAVDRHLRLSGLL